MKKNLKSLVEEITELTQDPWFQHWYEAKDQDTERHQNTRGGKQDVLAEFALMDS